MSLDYSDAQEVLRMVLGLRTAIYPAPDLAAAKRWYTDMLGVAPYFDEPFYVGFSVGGFELGLLPNATPGTVGPQPLWGVADIGSAYSRLIELGASPLEDRKSTRLNSSHLVISYAVFCLKKKKTVN